jgi:hypothetical protein
MVKRMKSLNKKTLNFEPPIHYVIEQEATTKGIKMSKGVESVFVTKQENMVLPRVKPTLVEGVLMAIRVRYKEPIFNQRNGSIVKGVLRDWSKGIHNMNKDLRPISPLAHIAIRLDTKSMNVHLLKIM